MAETFLTEGISRFNECFYHGFGRCEGFHQKSSHVKQFKTNLKRILFGKVRQRHCNVHMYGNDISDLYMEGNKLRSSGTLVNLSPN